jgi:hypothetical protein
MKVVNVAKQKGEKVKRDRGHLLKQLAELPRNCSPDELAAFNQKVVTLGFENDEKFQYEALTQTERDLKKAFPESDWAKRHLQIIYFGRGYCPARGHDPSLCPICAFAGKARGRS